MTVAIEMVILSLSLTLNVTTMATIPSIIALRGKTEAPDPNVASQEASTTLPDQVRMILAVVETKKSYEKSDDDEFDDDGDIVRMSRILIVLQQ